MRFRPFKCIGSGLLDYKLHHTQGSCSCAGGRQAARPATAATDTAGGHGGIGTADSDISSGKCRRAVWSPRRMLRGAPPAAPL